MFDIPCSDKEKRMLRSYEKFSPLNLLKFPVELLTLGTRCRIIAI